MYVHDFLCASQRRVQSDFGRSRALRYKAWVLALAILVLACSGKHRRFLEDSTASLDPGVNGAAGTEGDVPNPPGSLGASCTGSGECDTGFCVDGVCCDDGCSGVCQQCSSEGHCDLMPADDAACGEIACPASDECLGYPDLLTADRCLALGVCKTIDDCLATRVQVGQLCTASVQSALETRCDDSGSCVDSRGTTGAECTVNGECLTGACRSNVCCVLARLVADPRRVRA